MHVRNSNWSGLAGITVERAPGRMVCYCRRGKLGSIHKYPGTVFSWWHSSRCGLWVSDKIAEQNAGEAGRKQGLLGANLEMSLRWSGKEAFRLGNENWSRNISPGPAVYWHEWGSNGKGRHLSFMDLTEELTQEPTFQVMDTSSSLPRCKHPETHW